MRGGKETKKVNKHININRKRLSYSCLSDKQLHLRSNFPPLLLLLLRFFFYCFRNCMTYYKNHVYCLLTMTNIYHIFRFDIYIFNEMAGIEATEAMALFFFAIFPQMLKFRNPVRVRQIKPNHFGECGCCTTR